MPDWFPLIVASRALGVSPIELANSSIDWFLIGLSLSQAQQIVEDHHRRPSGKK